MDLREKTISGVTWSAVDSFSSQGILFVVGIILARLVSPAEFGLIGMTTIFIAISRTFIDSGFTTALIRKNNCTSTDYSTVFYYNLGMGLIFYLILFFSATPISKYFNEPQLTAVIRVLGLDLIIRSLTIIQSVMLIKRVDFKFLAKISVVSTVFSGILGIVMAVKGYGVWSLVVRIVAGAFFTSLFLWLWNRWRPSFIFSKKSILELFGFGSKLLASGLIDTIYKNIYYLIIGKYFSARELGLYTRAQNYVDLPSQMMTGIISRVTYPVLVQIQDNNLVLKGGYKRMITSSTFITFLVMAGMASTAEPLVITLIGEPWRPSIIYLQMLCFVGMMYPLQSLNLNMLNVRGRSDLYLKLEIIKKLLALPVIVAGVIWGIKVMIAGMIANSVISYFLNSYWSGKMVCYPMHEQVADIIPSFLLAVFMGSVVYISGILLPFGYLAKLIIQVHEGIILVFIISELFRLSPYLYLKEIVITKIKSFLNARQ